MTFSRKSLDLLSMLVDNVKLSAKDPNLVEMAAAVANCRQELREAINEASQPKIASGPESGPQEGE